MTHSCVAIGDVVFVEARIDPVVEAHGFGPRSEYEEHCWLPLLGPNATLLYRRLGTLVLSHTCPVEVDLLDLSLSLGLGPSLGRSGSLSRAMERLVAFDAMSWRAEEVRVRRALPVLPDYRVAQLGLTARGIHNHLTAPLPAA